MDINEKMKDLCEGAMSLYNTIEGEVSHDTKEYVDATTKVKEVLSSEEPIYVPGDDPVANMLFQYVNVGYGLCGTKYLTMLINNESITETILGFALQKINELAKENQDLAVKLEKYEPSENGIKEQKLEGISEN